MARWPDIAPWVGPSPNKTVAGLKVDNVRGVVIHIASGFYQGTIAWQRNPDANVSSHFIVGRDGSVVQMVDTGDASWAQKAGNSTWLSVENEGFAVDDGLHATHAGWESLTPAQIEVNARIFAKAHQVYGANVPLQLATSPAGRGLGHHSMGAESGYDWGHSQCPGSAIKAQKPAILARAVAIASGAPSVEEDDMDLNDSGPGAILPGATNRDVLRSMLGLLISQATGTRRDDLITWNAKDVPDNFWPAFRQLATAGGPTDEQVAAQADRIAAALVARPDNPLGDADQPAIVAAVKQALREGVA